MNERLNRFTSLLKQIFELDKSDLDFGIYRVMNLRKAQIEEFLTERLPQMVQETLAPFAQGSKEEIRAKMKQIEDSVSEMGMTVDALPDTAQKKQQYLQLQKQLAEGADLAALETDVYSALYSFFNRYYEDGDFISKRRYKEGVYAIPYEGEEVKLYWANQDQYYIKTSENFKDYTFVFDGITVHFRLVDATTEQNNNKESKDSKARSRPSPSTASSRTIWCWWMRGIAACPATCGTITAPVFPKKALPLSIPPPSNRR